MREDTSFPLVAWLDAQAHRENACVLDGGTPLSWAQLARRSRSVAAGLAEMGVKPGDRVGLWLPDRAAWLVTFLACARLGAAVVAIDTRLGARALGAVLRRSAAKVLMYWPDYRSIDFASVLAQCPAEDLERLRRVVLYAESTASLPPSVLGKPATSFARLLTMPPEPPQPPAPPIPGDTSCLLTTSGPGSDTPALSVHTQQQVMDQAHALADAWALDADQRFLLLSPLCGVFGMLGSMAALQAGSLLVIAAGWSATAAADRIDQSRITHLLAAPDMMATLLDTRPGSASLRSLEQAIVVHADEHAPGGAALAGLIAHAAQRGVQVLPWPFSVAGTPHEPDTRA